MSDFYLLPATAATGERLTEILTDHRVVFEMRPDVIAIVGPQNHARIVALLRHLLSEAERRAVSVFAADGTQFPAPRLLDEWWRVFQTAWFAKAFSEDLFTTWFQPIMDTARHRILGHECLIRLSHGRTYSGAEILDAAWVRDEIHVFDAYARRLAIRSAARESVDGIYFVNFMPSSIQNPELCLRTTLQTLHDSGLKPRNIVFEVVEAELIQDRRQLYRICDFYRSHGFGLALDDLGTRAESLQMLCDLQPDFIKLDKALARNAEQPVYASTIRKLVELSDRFGVTAVAKGVESRQMMENLWLLGMQNMQGYLFGRPGPWLFSPPGDLTNLAMALNPVHAASEEFEAEHALAIN